MLLTIRLKRFVIAFVLLVLWTDLALFQTPQKLKGTEPAACSFEGVSLDAVRMKWHRSSEMIFSPAASSTELGRRHYRFGTFRAFNFTLAFSYACMICRDDFQAEDSRQLVTCDGRWWMTPNSSCLLLDGSPANSRGV